MSLQPWMVAAGWKPNVARLYRPSSSRVGEVLPVPGCESLPGRRKTTSNFDQKKSFAGQSNQDNQMTSDEFRFPVGYDVRAGDLLEVFGVGWYAVAGDPMTKDLIPRQVTFITVTTPPLVGDGEWSDV